MQVLIIGANGSVAKLVTEGLLQNENVNLKLYLRNGKRLIKLQSERTQIIEGDALDKEALKKAMANIDVVYANLAGSELPKMAQTIVNAMNETGIKRLIWISAYGVYQKEYKEVPNRNFGSVSSALKPYADSVKVIESSGLDYTIIRPQWFSNADEVDYELTKKGEVFKNPDAQISRKSIAHLVVRLCLEKDLGIKESFGINKPAK